MRADRLNLSDSAANLTETNTQHIFQQIQEVQPSVLVIDHSNFTDQYIDSSPGSISQIRECTAELMNMLKLVERLYCSLDISIKMAISLGPKY